ncbi:MAG: GIY-YIG nuclease family protein [Gemmatimonadaceae bacterium]
MTRARASAHPSPDVALATMRDLVRKDAQDRPGVYRMISEKGEVLYVGKSKRVRSRLLSYFRCVFPEEKGARMVREARTVEWEYMPSEFAALLQELRLIKRHRPRFNVALMRDARHFAFIKITASPAPKLLVVRGASDDAAAAYYGPFYGAQSVGESVRELNDVLGLRDCAVTRRMYFAGQQELFQVTPRTPGCIRFEVKKCLGPCVEGCSEHQYADRMRVARSFLDGVDNEPLDTLRAVMEECSRNLEFERAAMLRDKLWRLQALREQFLRFRFAVESLSFLYTVAGYGGDDRVYIIRRGRVRAEEPAPRSSSDRLHLQQLADDIFRPSERNSGQVPAHEVDELMVLSAWFKKNPNELRRARESAVGSRESGVGSRESGVGSRESGVDNNAAIASHP